MTVVILSRAALRDLEAARDHLVEAAGLEVALRFIEGIEKACDLLSDFPRSGASWGFVAPGVRRWNVPGFPYGLFYRHEAEGILHSARDIPASLRRG